jgi:hypothetical protein
MGKVLNTFQRRHQEKLDQLERGEDEEALLDRPALPSSIRPSAANYGR